jgi:hypothetical protein
MAEMIEQKIRINMVSPIADGSSLGAQFGICCRISAAVNQPMKRATSLCKSVAAMLKQYE